MKFHCGSYEQYFLRHHQYFDSTSIVALAAKQIYSSAMPEPEKEGSTKKFYDEAFREVFSNVNLVKSLLTDFVGEDWVTLIDFSTMKVKASTFKGISEDKRESDLLLEFSLKDNTKILIFILIEFQSAYEQMMLRLLEYLLRIYREQLKTSDKLSVVVPIVIYNGTEAWKEDRQFIRYFQIPHDDLKKYIPDFKYILVDVNRLDDELLRRLKTEVSYFFLLDKTNLHDVEEASERIRGIFREIKDRYPGLSKLLARYMRGLLNYKGIEVEQIIDYLSEGGRSMLAQSIEEIRQEGMHENQIETAKRMLLEDFGVEKIAKLTGLSVEEIKKLKA